MSRRSTHSDSGLEMARKGSSSAGSLLVKNIPKDTR